LFSIISVSILEDIQKFTKSLMVVVLVGNGIARAANFSFGSDSGFLFWRIELIHYF